MDVKVNINDIVKVKLTEFGISILKQNHDEVNEILINRGVKPMGPFELKLDDNGYMAFQLWQLMSIYGEHLSVTGENPFETQIIIPDVEFI
jgi:hypothetical protein